MADIRPPTVQEEDYIECTPVKAGYVNRAAIDEFEANGRQQSKRANSEPTRSHNTEAVADKSIYHRSLINKLTIIISQLI